MPLLAHALHQFKGVSIALCLRYAGVIQSLNRTLVFDWCVVG